MLVDWKVGEPPAGSREYPYLRELHDLLLLAQVLHLDKRGEHHDEPEDPDLPSETDRLLPRQSRQR